MGAKIRRILFSSIPTLGKGMNRHRTITTKVKTPFGSLYTHVSHDEGGRAVEVRISSPGKFSETEMGEALTALATAITIALKDIPMPKLKED